MPIFPFPFPSLLVTGRTLSHQTGSSSLVPKTKLHASWRHLRRKCSELAYTVVNKLLAILYYSTEFKSKKAESYYSICAWYYLGGLFGCSLVIQDISYMWADLQYLLLVMSSSSQICWQNFFKINPTSRHFFESKNNFINFGLDPKDRFKCRLFFDNKKFTFSSNDPSFRIETV